MKNYKKYYKTSFLILLFLLIAYSLPLNATIRYVSKTGLSVPPYTTWETASDSIQKCINISVFGDTIYVANGVYQEQVVMIPGLSLIGAGADSCVINLTTTGIPAVEIKDTCLLTGFKIFLPNTLNTWGIKADTSGVGSKITLNKIVNASLGIYVRYSNPYVYRNEFVNIKTRGIWLFNSNSFAKKNYILTDPNSEAGQSTGIYIDAFTNDYQPIIDSNYIATIYEGIRKSIGANPVIKNNTIIMKYASVGIFLSTSDSTKIFNNLILVDSIAAVEGIVNYGVTFLELDNNYLRGKYLLSGMYLDGYDKVRNNVIENAETGVEVWGTQGLQFQYNNIWNNEENYSGFIPDTTNLSVDPMIMNDDTTQGDLDFRLQMYSPLINAGDPTILDRDGSRSDIGLYGGPYGWTYTYEDLAPRPPHNVTASIEEGLVKLTWNKNTEADFSHYRIYRDTVTILIYDSTKMIAETPDTFYYDQLPPVNHESRFYYVITAFDNQGNQSYPSEEINVLVTGLGEHPPKGYDGYRLLANYPNPFNPSTKIPYRLKEAGYVKLYVYDLKGELVKVIVNQWQEKGFYEVVFHPTLAERGRVTQLEVPMGKRYNQMSSGIYLFTIQVYDERNIPVFSDAEKMILLK